MKIRCALLLVSLLLGSSLTPAQGDPWTAAASPISAPTKEQKTAQEVVALTNAVRAERGLPPLQPLACLDAAAAGHSQEMLDLDYFSHTSPTPGRAAVSHRIVAAGGTWRACAENIYMSSGMPLESSARAAVDGWVESPGHFQNMINPSYTHIGVGIAYRQGTLYATQVFSRP